jgi:hypothetical protein
MVKIEAGKSRKWYSCHCAICKKYLRPTTPRVSGTAVLMDDSVIDICYCEKPCATEAQMQQDAERAAEQLRNNNTAEEEKGVMQE